MADTTTITLAEMKLNVPGLSAKGYALLNTLTAKRIWDDTDLQYMFTNDETYDSGGIRAYFRVRSLDESFGFTELAERAYASVNAISNLEFTSTTNDVEADHILGTITDRRAGIEGFFEFPGSGYSFGVINQGPKQMAAPPALAGDGEYANWTVLHEIGHGLGLKHTHQERRGIPALPEVGRFMNNERYSVMSYHGSANASSHGHAVSFMALDVAALQALYGAEDYATSGSLYTLLNAGDGALVLDEGDVDIGRAYYCIWDSAGIDQIDYGSSDRSVLINLNDATLDTSKPTGDLKALIAQLTVTAFFKDLSAKLQDEITDAWHHAGGFFSRVLASGGGDYKGTAGGFSIAHGAEIENANGGNKNDLLIGNEGDNTLFGFAGNDTMLGGSGNDTLDGGDGNDRLDGGRGADQLTGGLGMDWFVFSTGYGTDTITDFEEGDLIDVSRLQGFKNFTKFFNENVVEGSGEVVITMGGDVLTITGIHKDDLSRPDFVI